jgi:hypothetical protein
MAPEVGFEPTTNRLTADRSTTELLRSLVGQNSNRGVGGFKRKSASPGLADLNLKSLGFALYNMPRGSLSPGVVDFHK